jgi:hypothetical protein
MVVVLEEVVEEEQLVQQVVAPVLVAEMAW